VVKPVYLRISLPVSKRRIEESARELVELFPDSKIWLIHGRPTLLVPPYIEYGHAWIEVGDSLCFDTELEYIFYKPFYYKEGSIKLEDCLRYTLDEMEEWIFNTDHWGPWEGSDA
jgi:hypothetical protein